MYTLNSTIDALRQINLIKNQINKKEVADHLLEFAKSMATDELWEQIYSSPGFKDIEEEELYFCVTCPVFNDGDPCIPHYSSSYALDELELGALVREMIKEWQEIVPSEYEIGFTLNVKDKAVQLDCGIRYLY